MANENSTLLSQRRHLSTGSRHGSFRWLTTTKIIAAFVFILITIAVVFGIQRGKDFPSSVNNSWIIEPASYPCPGSPVKVHASCRVRVIMDSTCDTVVKEIESRFAGQYDKWHDPHNNGTYYGLVKVGSNELHFLRRTGNQKYIDKIGISLDSLHDNSSKCELKGCSESQVFSVYDYSTNYCTLFNLYCGTSAGCKIVKNDLTFKEMKVEPSIGSSAVKETCLSA